MNDISIISSCDSTVQDKWCAELYKRKLYRPNGGYITWLQFPPMNGFKVMAVAMEFVSGELVGSAAVRENWFDNGLNFSIFVREDLRRRGIGTLLYQRCAEEYPGKILVYAKPDGVREKFFASVRATEAPEEKTVIY